MTIRLLATYKKFKPNTIVTLASAEETALVAGGNATTDLSGGVPFDYKPPANTRQNNLSYAADGTPLGVSDSTGKILAGFAGISAPGAPTGLALTAIAGGVLAVMTSPANTGGTAIIGYEVTLSNGLVQLGETTTVAVNSPAGVAVTATAKAINGFDKSVASTVSNSVTPTGTVVPVAPGAPTVTATAGNASASVTITAGAGGTPTGYTVASSPAGGVDASAGTTTSLRTITGLTNGTAYTFTATATNAAGSATSAASAPVTPVSSAVAPAVTSAPVILGTPTVGTPVSATAGTYTGSPTPTVVRQWLVAGTVVATASTYTPVSGDATKVLTVRETATNTAGNVVSNSGGVTITAASGNTIGPYTIGQVVVENGNNMIVTMGDDFNGALSLLDAGSPQGLYVPTRTYMGATTGNGPRGNTSSSLSLLGHDVSPGYTGYNDANRGVPVPSFSDSHVQSNSFITLKSRTASTAERALAPSSSLPDNSAMISTATAFSFMAPFAIEDRYARLKSQPNMRGWHDTYWLEQMGPVPTYTNTEIDWEATSLSIAPNRVYWTAGTPTNSPGTDQPDLGDGTFYKRRISVDGVGTITHSQDGVIKKSFAPVSPYAVDLTRPFYAMLTNHIADFTNDPYTDADWVAAGAPGATSIHDYLAVMTSTGTVYTPLVGNETYNVAFGAAMSQVLPTTTALWGSAVTENLESFATESNEPGGNYNGGYRGLAPGLTYTPSTFTLAGTITSRPGRISIQRYTMMAGTACWHHRVTINVGPTITVSTLPPAVKNTAYSYDLYAVCDCGVLVCNTAGQKTKTVAVTGLPTGLTYSDVTGLITGTTTVDFNKSLTVTVTNSVGQSVTSLIDFTTAGTITGNTGVAAPVIQGSPVLRNSWDFDNLTTLTVDGSTPPIISSVAGTDGMTLALANATPATAPTRVARASGRFAAHFTRTAAQFLQATGLTLTAGGSQVVIYEPATVGNSQVVLERANSAAATTTSREQLIGVASSGVAARRSDSASVTNDASTISARNTAALSVAVIVFDASSVTMYFNGTSTGITVPTTGLPAGMNSITMGSRFAASALTLPFDGYVLRVLDYSTVFTAAQAEEAAVWARANYNTTNLA